MPTENLPVADPYSSRLGNQWEIAPRVDPVLWAPGANGPLSESQRQTFENWGYYPFPQLISTDRAQSLLAEAKYLQQSLDPNLDYVISEPNHQEIRSIFRVHEDNPRFEEVCRDEQIVGIARQILGSDVYLHQSRINFKPGFRGKEFFWHSDFETWHVEDGMPRMRAVSISLSLTENNAYNGPLMLVRGSHLSYVRCVGETPEEHFRSSLKKQEFGVPNREALRLLVEQGEIVAPTGGPGSAVMFDCNTMHASVSNLSPYPRTNLFLVFNSVENRLEEPFGGTPPRPRFLSYRP
ncbi:ectoine hydroxylase [Blastopirellula marina]|uniref:Ectoine hydroxylase n=1 Tax=Blastopirellula marina TaxID=124 RepID=A0A2S8GBC7_9BACT|nr:ectoine hydroxylase [Blastopirellula marina]PQO41733.1 ectoine hydroxylase [Blastopirellula marina]PTL46176.1 ectoine hydroxylase [Blastopirellula marina]